MDQKGLVELLVDQKCSGSLVGNVYTGIVKNILPSQFAFVDIGESRNGFLFLNDRKESMLYEQKKDQENGPGKLLLKCGQSLLVQVQRDETGEKGVNLTTQINFTGRFCVLIVTGRDIAGVSVSKKITDQEERKRLRQAALSLLPPGYEAIMRTNSQGRTSDEITAELSALLAQAQDMQSRWPYVKAPAPLSIQNEGIVSHLRDLYNESVQQVLLNDKEAYAQAKAAVADYFPGAANRIQLYEQTMPLFDAFGIEKQITQALHKKVWLDSGGFLYIEQTEACAVIDVNSGKYLGKKDHEQSALRLNIEACHTIARQIRLRNLSGIIIIDFIDMKAEESKAALIDAFRKALSADRISAHVVGMTALGLMEMTRKRTREPLIASLGKR